MGSSSDHRRLRFEALEQRNLLAIIPVNSLLDNGDGANTTLREAINAATTGDTIVFEVTGTIQLTSAGDDHLVVDEGITIQGPGADLLTIRAHHGSSEGRRIFFIDNGSSSLANVTISGMTLTAGDLTSGDPDTIAGGAIYNRENLTVVGCVITGNTAPNGGGIYSRSGSLSVIDSVISNNTSEDGGAILVESGSASVIRSTLSGNFAGNEGGAIFKRGSGDLSVLDSTISGNTSDLYGGGISKYSGSLTITNSTISGNTVNNYGGGVYNWAGPLDINHSTITGNRITSDFTYGGGVASGPNVNLNHTIIAGNLRNTNTANDLFGNFTATYSIIGTSSQASVTNSGGTSIVGISVAAVGLGPLANNGGPTRTHALLTGSAAIDAGNSALVAGTSAPSFDQRGTPYARTADGDGGGGNRIDIGAFEVPTPIQLFPEVAASGNGVEIMDGDMSPSAADGTDFGSMLQGGAAVERTFTVRNDGTGPLTLGEVSVPAGFTVVDPLVTSLEAGGTDALIIRLDTTTAGIKMGDVSFTTDDSDEPTFNFSITGTVIAVPELPGDYNLNAIVDAADYVIWRKLFGATVGVYQEPDGNGDTIIDGGDYNVWSENFGETLASGGGGDTLDFDNVQSIHESTVSRTDWQTFAMHSVERRQADSNYVRPTRLMSQQSEAIFLAAIDPKMSPHRRTPDELGVDDDRVVAVGPTNEEADAFFDMLGK